MRLQPHHVFAALLALLALHPGVAGGDEREEFFEARIRPVLAEVCFRCHGDVKTSGALRVDSREQLIRGGDTGPAILPGNPDESLLIRAIERQADVAPMPPEKQQSLRPDQLADFRTWIKSGAVWPKASPKFETGSHWSFEPIRDPALPVVQDTAWASNSIDAFVRAKQELAGVRPALAADKLTLIRRATFDLTGLPPSPEEVTAFLQDASPQAFATVVDRLLQSPAYGERWGRHWLDVVRYADTAGETADYPVPLAWRYRNYVVDAFNADLPYDEFLREQIAGDVLAHQGPPEQYAQRVTATGYLALSRRFGFDSENYHHLTIQDTIDTLGQSVLGLSLGCARCHDHKFDPVSMHDYYGLYGVFASSRYPFPGSEQKQKVRALTPLVPPEVAQPQWREFENRVAVLESRLSQFKQAVPQVVLRSLADMDGDFELQAPAAGGSQGVLVPPWLYTGKIAVTTAAQSPYKNLYPFGRVGASVPAGAGEYCIQQAIHPSRSRNHCHTLYVNLDFRVATADANVPGAHRFRLGGSGKTPAVELLFTSATVSLRVGESTEKLAALQPNQWHNLQLALDLESQSLSGKLSTPTGRIEFKGKPLRAGWSGTIDLLTLTSDETNLASPAIEFDNLGVQQAPLNPVSGEQTAGASSSNEPDPVKLTAQLQLLTGIDGDLELQTKDKPPASPWNAGPSSVVKLSSEAQSPYQNVYSRGNLGMRMPNRGEYDGFGLTLPAVKPDQHGRLFVGFDFRCASQAAGGDGSWRYYLGHGPGNSAAVELYFNGREFFCRSADVHEPVCSLAIGEWYQVQMIVDTSAKTYKGVLASAMGKKDFEGQFATGWDGVIDYSFIDSYGHLGGVRPALDADNFVLGPNPLPPFDAPPIIEPADARSARRAQVEELRRRLAALQAKSSDELQQLTTLLETGPFAMAYGMSEGTPHDVRMQLRGEPGQPGAVVPRGFLPVLGGGPLAAESLGSGRLELARWLIRPDNPLTARVIVNRIWQYHFGRGIVKTSNDFGVRGLAPTHPELLDHLATQFMRRDWSVKAMHRQIMLSATYQQSSLAEEFDAAAPQSAGEIAPEATDLYVGFSRRRLSAEEIRDAILMVSGELDRTRGREHPFPSPLAWGYTQHNPFSAIYDHNRRSIYLMTQRLKRHPFLALFDGADPNATTAERLGTTVPTQALYFLNDPFIHEKADKWASQLQLTGDPSEQINWAWRSAVGRPPSAIEEREALEFLAAYRAELTAANLDHVDRRSLAAYLRTIFASNEFLHVD